MDDPKRLPKINVRLTGVAQSYSPEIQYVLDEISMRSGYAFCIASDTTSNGSCDFSYGTNVASGTHLAFDESLYRQTEPTPECLLSPHHNDKKNGSAPDVIGNIFYLLTLRHESSSALTRDEFGNLSKSDVDAVFPSWLYRSVETCVLELNEVIGIKPSLESIWPNSASSALLLTHDTDAVSNSVPMELLYNFAKVVLRQSCDAWHMLRSGMSNLHKENLVNPLFGFPKWVELEGNYDLRSTFLLSTRKIVPRHKNDVRSSVDDFNERAWDVLRSYSAMGWEFGYHPAINAGNSIDELIAAKYFLEQKLGCSIEGVRHHYWSINWAKPYLTYRMQVNAGFRYDLTTAFRDGSGLRYGTSFPFRPWDPVRRRALEIYVIPTVLMDGHLSRDLNYVDRSNKALGILSEQNISGGIICTDWHTESTCNSFYYSGDFDTYKNMIEELSANTWNVTASELVRFWHARYLRVSEHRIAV